MDEHEDENPPTQILSWAEQLKEQGKINDLGKRVRDLEEEVRKLKSVTTETKKLKVT